MCPVCQCLNLSKTICATCTRSLDNLKAGKEIMILDVVRWAAERARAAEREVAAVDLELAEMRLAYEPHAAVAIYAGMVAMGEWAQQLWMESEEGCLGPQTYVEDP